MTYKNNTYISNEDLMFQGVLNDIKKSRTPFQPIFEAFTNAIESIRIKTKKIGTYEGKITIEVNAVETTGEQNQFHSISIKDNGIGFDETEFKRFNKYKDYTKGFKNLGSGRIQFVHYFDNTVIKSIFKDNDGHFFKKGVHRI